MSSMIKSMFSASKPSTTAKSKAAAAKFQVKVATPQYIQDDAKFASAIDALGGMLGDAPPSAGHGTAEAEAAEAAEAEAAAAKTAEAAAKTAAEAEAAAAKTAEAAAKTAAAAAKTEGGSRTSTRRRRNRRTGKSRRRRN